MTDDGGAPAARPARGSLLSDLRVLKNLLLSGRGGADHGARMEGFYAGQAADYDNFRRRLLQGREALIADLPVAGGEVLVDLGGGTGANVEFMDEARRAQLGAWHIVDLAGSLLEVANQRIEARGWNNVHAVCTDATTWRPPGDGADIVLMSYSLTMMPDWLVALEHAADILKPGGHIALVDFYVSRKYVQPPQVAHGGFTRNTWPAWFGWDDVFLNADHLPWLVRHFETVRLVESRAKLPYLPFVRVPYYRFMGRKKGRKKGTYLLSR